MWGRRAGEEGVRRATEEGLAIVEKKVRLGTKFSQSQGPKLKIVFFGQKKL
jgi:hypothetical protein